MTDAQLLSATRQALLNWLKPDSPLDAEETLVRLIALFEREGWKFVE